MRPALTPAVTAAAVLALFTAACEAPPAQQPAQETTTPSAASPAPAATETASSPAADVVPFPEDPYLPVLSQDYPVAFERWSQGLRAANAPRSVWLYDLEGTHGPLEAARLDGRDYVFRFVCMPHNCGNNQVGVLFAADQSRAVGLVRIVNEATGAVTVTDIGAPTAAERACIVTKLDDEGAAC